MRAAAVGAAKALLATRMRGGVQITPRWVKSATGSYLFHPAMAFDGFLQEIDGYPVEVTGNFHTIVLVAEDRKGSIARITSILAEHDINIATLRLSRKERGGDAFMVIECDEEPDRPLPAGTPVPRQCPGRTRTCDTRFRKPIQAWS